MTAVMMAMPGLPIPSEPMASVQMDMLESKMLGYITGWAPGVTLDELRQSVEQLLHTAPEQMGGPL